MSERSGRIPKDHVAVPAQVARIALWEMGELWAYGPIESHKLDTFDEAIADLKAIVDNWDAKQPKVEVHEMEQRPTPYWMRSGRHG